METTLDDCNGVPASAYKEAAFPSIHTDDVACHDIAQALQNMRERWIKAQQCEFGQMTATIERQEALIERQGAQIEVLTETSRETQKKKDLKYKVTVLESAFTKLLGRIDELTGASENESKKESFYQGWLAKTLDGGHRTTEAGITDVSTDSFDMEIKTFKKWKTALRQNHAYNVCTKTDNRVLALFDVKDDHQMDKLIAACKIFDVRLIFLGPNKSYKNVSPADGALGENWRYDVDVLKEALCKVKLRVFNEQGDRQVCINNLYSKFLTDFIEPEDDPDKALQWQYLREVFRKWYNLDNSVKLGQRADDVKKYFNTRLGGYQNTTRRNIPVRGYLGWRLIADRVKELEARHKQRYGLATGPDGLGRKDGV